MDARNLQFVTKVDTTIPVGNGGIVDRHGFNSPYIGTVCFAAPEGTHSMSFVDIDVTREQLENLRDNIDNFLKTN